MPSATIWTVTLVLLLGPGVSMLISGLLAIDKIGRDLVGAARYLPTFVSFAAWVAVSNIAVILVTRAGVLILAILKPATVVGQYSLAATLASAALVAVNSMTTAMLPTASRLSTRDEVLAYIRRALRLSIPICLVMVPFMVFADPLVYAAGGPRFADAVWPFRILAFTLMVNVMANPIGLLVYTFGRPTINVLANAIQLMLIVVLTFWLAPRLGAVGPAAALCAATVVGGGLVIGWIALRIRKYDRHPIVGPAAGANSYLVQPGGSN